jgi:hypothetical protein
VASVLLSKSVSDRLRGMSSPICDCFNTLVYVQGAEWECGSSLDKLTLLVSKKAMSAETTVVILAHT